MKQAPVVFDGVRFHVRRAQLSRRDGGVQPRELVVPPDSVVVLPLLDERTVVLIRNERFAVGKTLWEVCAGTLEEGEDPDACAGRELQEETGYRAGTIERLCSFYPTPGFCTEFMHGYIARNLEQVGQALDETERIEPHPLAKDEALAMIRDGRIIDAKTVALLLYWHTFGTRTN